MLLFLCLFFGLIVTAQRARKKVVTRNSGCKTCKINIIFFIINHMVFKFCEFIFRISGIKSVNTENSTATETFNEQVTNLGHVL